MAGRQAAQLRGCKPLLVTGEAASSIRAEDGQKGVSDRRATIHDITTVFTHEPLQESRGSGHTGFWPEVAGCPLQREWQTAPPAGDGVSPIHPRTPGVVG